MALDAGLYQFILGRDSVPHPMPSDFAARNLADPFAKLLLREGIFPLTLRQLLVALDAANATVSGVPAQKVFIVADGGQIRWTSQTSNVDRQMRLVVSRGVAGKTPTVFISTSTEIESATTFLQVLAWDEHNGVYHWYDRRGPAWIWAGNSWDALAPDTRGHGPFDSHDPLAFRKVTRGTTAKALRAVFAVPEELGYKVGDIKINNRPIEFGSQIADSITIKLTGLATRLGLSKVQPVEGCVGPALQGDFAPASVAELLNQRRQGRI